MKGLLNRKPNERLGAGPEDAKHIMVRLFTVIFGPENKGKDESN